MKVRSAFLSAAILSLCWADLIFAQAPPAAYKTIEFDSPSVGRKMKYNLVLPDGYEESTERYPVLYLLHGYSSNYTAWVRMGVPAYARNYKLIVVMPDAGNSWYVNWAKSEDGQKNAWEDAIVKDLISHVDNTYRTVASRAGRAINGLSMGGYGGLTLGLRHPELFCSVGSQSGALAWAKDSAKRITEGKPFAPRQLRTEQNKQIAIEGFMSQLERTPKGQMFVTAEDAAAYDPFQLVLKIPADQMPHICIDCGTEDTLIRASQDFLKLMMEHKIPFTYSQSKGEHKSAYWAREIGEAMAIQMAIMQRNMAAKPATQKASAK